jgi:hypothetical protein
MVPYLLKGAPPIRDPKTLLGSLISPLRLGRKLKILWDTKRNQPTRAPRAPRAPITPKGGRSLSYNKAESSFYGL